MGDAGVILASLLAGFVIVIGGGLVVYMASLAKSAYQLKFELDKNLETGLSKIEEQVDRTIRWNRRELGEEIDKSRVLTVSDNERRFNELVETFTKNYAEWEERVTQERANLAKAIDGLRREVREHESQIFALRHRNRVVPAQDKASPAAEGTIQPQGA